MARPWKKSEIIMAQHGLIPEGRTYMACKLCLLRLYGSHPSKKTYEMNKELMSKEKKNA